MFDSNALAFKYYIEFSLEKNRDSLYHFKGKKFTMITHLLMSKNKSP